MKKTIFLKLFLVLSLVVLTGASCISFNTGAGADAGVWKSINASEDWTQLTAYPTASGVNSIGGIDVETLAIDPQDNLAIYAGTVEEGMFFSYDAGISWMRSQDESVNSGKISSIGVDPTNKCIIFAVKGRQIYKSTDCNRTYEPIFEEARSKEVVTELVIDWYNPQTIWAGTSAGDVLKSVDGGLNWANIQLVKDDVTAILVDNADSRVVLVATEGKGLWKTADGGETWVELEEQLEDFNNADSIHAIVQDKDASVYYMSSQYGILKSTDKGETWEKVDLLTPAGKVTVRGLAVDPNDTNKIYYGTLSTFYKSTDGGLQWDTRKLPSTKAVSEILVSPGNSDVLYMSIKEVK